MRSLYPNTSISLLQTTNIFILIFMCLLSLLTFFRLSHVPDGISHLTNLLSAILIFGTLAYGICIFSRANIQFFLHLILVMGIYSYLFQAVGPLQLTLHSQWLDPYLISAEVILFGNESSLLLQQITNPILTEWLMFSYVFYVPLLPGVALVCFISASRNSGEKYLFDLALANSICYSGFILFPVATPLFYMPELYSIQLEGGIFTSMGEWIRENQHYTGGGLPSPHTAAGTIMIIHLFRSNRKIFYITLPIIISIYLATVYGRYHYMWDSLLGVLTAFMVAKYSPAIFRLINHIIGYVEKLTGQIQIHHQTQEAKK